MELSVVEQRYRVVLDVGSGMAVTEVAARYGVSRQSVHAWLRRYADDIRTVRRTTDQPVRNLKAQQRSRKTAKVS